MPVFVEDPSQFSKERLKSELVSHKVDLPPADSKKHVYVELYKKHVGTKNGADFSSDEEDQVQDGSEEEEEERGEESDMVDLSLLTDDQLKKKLLQYGVKAGPIVASTRSLYERKLHRLMTNPPNHRVNGTSDAGRYSDSEEEEQDEEEEDESGSEQLGPETVPETEPSATASTIEKRLSPKSKSAATERTNSRTPVPSKVQRGPHSVSKTSNTTLYLTPECSPHQKHTTTIKPTLKTATDVLTELFPDAAVTPTGITATKRRSIKGAAGRPVQFKYPETPVSPTTQERREIQQRLVPVWVQIVVFVLVIALLYLIYVSMENPPENPFSTLLEDLTPEETINDEVPLISSPPDTSAYEAAA